MDENNGESEVRETDSLRRQADHEVSHVITGEVKFPFDKAYTVPFDPEIPLDAAVTIMVKGYNRLAAENGGAPQIFENYGVIMRVAREEGSVPYSQLDQFVYKIDKEGFLRAHTLCKGANETRTVGEFAHLELDGKGGFKYEGQVNLQIARFGMLHINKKRDLNIEGQIQSPEDLRDILGIGNSDDSSQ